MTQDELTQDVLDVIDAAGNVSHLLLLSPQTPTGGKLRDTLAEMRSALLSQRDSAKRLLEYLQAEVEGLRAQNAQLTEALHKTELELARRRILRNVPGFTDDDSGGFRQ